MKKRWLINDEDNRKFDENIDISWSSSDDEDRTNYKSRKKLKFEVTNQNLSKTAVINHDVSQKQRNLDESPILGHTSFEQQSPVLTETNEGTSETSPIIGSKPILKRVLHNRNVDNRTEFKCLSSGAKQRHRVTSPDIFATQSTYIIDASSPQKTQKFKISEASNSQNSDVEISQFESQMCVIESFPSDNSSKIAINSISDVPSVSDGEPILYYHIVPKKKRLKKGGLADQLQKALKLQQTNVAIWEHELYLNKTSEYVIDEDFIHLKILKQWSEYGSNLFECVHVNNFNKCIVLLNSNPTCCEFKLYEPYNVKTINHNGKPVDCYYNVSKILFE